MKAKRVNRYNKQKLFTSLVQESSDALKFPNKPTRFLCKIAFGFFWNKKKNSAFFLRRRQSPAVFRAFSDAFSDAAAA